MKKKININKKYFLILFMIIIFIACNGNNTNMTDKKILLKTRVEEFCNLIEGGNFKQTRKYYIPTWQNKPEQEYKKDLSSLSEINKGMFDYYKIKSIIFKDDIAEILINYSMLNKKYTAYDYWIFVKDNWYIVDYGRLDPASSYEIKLYKELVHDDQK